MKIAVFGGTGFVGYNFLRLCRRESAAQCLVYTGSPDQLVNLSRHQVEVQPVDWSQLDKLDLPEHIETIVNFSHPFGKRAGLTAEEQIEKFGAFVQRNARGRTLGLIQLSSMVVYEPFRAGFEFPEGADLKVPASDEYASQKVYLEKAVRSWGVPVANLRPTIVYGPFGVDFTDLFFNGFASGDIEFHNLDGKIQPIFVEDISRFVLKLLNGFVDSTFNLAGPETISWRDYLDFHGQIVDFGGLVHRPQIRRLPPARPTRLGLARDVLRNLFRDPAFRDLIQPLVARMPQRFRHLAKRSVDVTPATAVASPRKSVPRPSPFNTNPALLTRLKNKLATDFFAQDRLVSMELMQKEHPEACKTTLHSTQRLLTDYLNFRFRDPI